MSKNTLKSFAICSAAAIGLSGIFAESLGELPLPPRALTAGEIELAQSVFGNQIDYSKITISRNGKTELENDGVISLYDSRDNCLDYSKKPCFFLYKARFMSEMTRIWQSQNDISAPSPTKPQEHPDALSIDREDFLTYSHLEQRRIIRKYTDVFLPHKNKAVCYNKFYTKIEGVVDRQFPAAKEHRETVCEDFIRESFARDYPYPTRALTEDEIALAQKVFGDTIDYTKIVIIHSPKHYPPFAAEAVKGRAIIVYASHHRENYAQGTGASIYMHEMQHILEQQNEQRYDYVKEYDYMLTAEKGFDDFQDEQKAEIVADYTSEFLVGPGAPETLCLTYTPFYDHLNQLKRTVLEKFPAAKAHQQKICAPKPMA